ncbi:hypothetical protein ACOSQ2_018676 [Xanthoceras sorbifolium]
MLAQANVNSGGRGLKANGESVIILANGVAVIPLENEELVEKNEGFEKMKETKVMGEFSHNSEPGVEVQRMDCRGSCEKIEGKFCLSTCLEGVAMEGIELNLKEEVICIEHDVRPNAEKVEKIVDPREKRVRKWKRALGPKARFWEKLRAQFRK